MAWTARTVRRLARISAWSVCPVGRYRLGPGLVIVQLLLLAGVLNLAWLFVVSPGAGGGVHGRADGAGPASFDGGVRLAFVNRARPDSAPGPGGIDVHRADRPAGCSDGSGPCSASGQTGANASHAKLSANAIPRRIEEASPIDEGNPVTSSHPPWCAGRSINSTLPSDIVRYTAGKKYFLAAVLLVRIYDYDLAKLTTRELVQWLQFLSYAGVEHVYVYDAYLYKNESQRDGLDCFVRSGYVTYVDWSHKARPKYTIAGTQVSAYQDCLTRYGAESAWQTAIDIDEYPFSPGDRSRGFLVRAVWELSNFGENGVGEISMDNYLFLGKQLEPGRRPLLIDRLWRRTVKRSNLLVKPVYRPDAVLSANVHHNSLRVAFVNRAAPAERLRMNHYWGARLQNWGEDTPEILAKTTEDRGMEEAVRALRPCLQNCGRGCCPK